MTTELKTISTQQPRKPARKMRRPAVMAVAAVLSLGLLSGCVTDQGNKQTMGTLLGAGLGGFAGSKIGGGKGQLAATAAGVVLGGLLGNNVGQSLDRADQAYAMRAQDRAMNAPVGQTISWSNPDSGNYGTVTPTRTSTDTRTGAYCREYQTEVIVGGESQVGYGTACRQPDGDWKIAS
ncbi:MAG: RT0821/Lpp0805 family surface protein [Rhodospirillales bacterium]